MDGFKNPFDQHEGEQMISIVEATPEHKKPEKQKPKQQSKKETIEKATEQGIKLDARQ